MKLMWINHASKIFVARFLHLELVIDYNVHKYGMYEGTSPVWEYEINDTPSWEDLAERAENELQYRLLQTAEDLDPRWLVYHQFKQWTEEPPLFEVVPVNEEYTEQAKAATDIVNYLYWSKEPLQFTDDIPASTQVADAIKKEASEVKL